jgi:hypothetical protein
MSILRKLFGRHQPLSHDVVVKESVETGTKIATQISALLDSVKFSVAAFNITALSSPMATLPLAADVHGYAEAITRYRGFRDENVPTNYTALNALTIVFGTEHGQRMFELLPAAWKDRPDDFEENVVAGMNDANAFVKSKDAKMIPALQLELLLLLKSRHERLCGSKVLHAALVQIGSANRLKLSERNELMCGDDQAEEFGGFVRRTPF